MSCKKRPAPGTRVKVEYETEVSIENDIYASEYPATILVNVSSTPTGITRVPLSAVTILQPLIEEGDFVRGKSSHSGKEYYGRVLKPVVGSEYIWIYVASQGDISINPATVKLIAKAANLEPGWRL